VSFDMPVQVELNKLSPHYSDASERHTLKFGISRDLWLKFEMPEPGKILRGLWWRKGSLTVEQIELRNFMPGFKPGFDPKRPAANANSYSVSFEVTEEVWNKYKPWKRSDFSGVLWGAFDDEFDARIVERWREKLAERAQADLERQVVEPKKEKKAKEPSPYGAFWHLFDRALGSPEQGGLINNPAFKRLICAEVAAPADTLLTTDKVREVVRNALGVKTRKVVAPDDFKAWLEGRGFTDGNFLLEIDRLSARARAPQV
jgi:hypothetical protein